MTIPPRFFLILAIVLTITKQQTLDFEPKPDWSRCEAETTCFCTGSQQKLSQISSAPIGEECNVGLQHKFFTEDVAVFQMQIIKQKLDLNSNPYMMLKLGENELFGCELNSKTNRIKVKGNADLIKKYKITLFEDPIRSRFESEFVLCAIKSGYVSKLYADTQNSPYSGKFMKLITSQPDIHWDFYLKGNALFKRNFDPKCDPYSFNDLSDSQGLHVLPLINRDKDMLKCDFYGESYSMIYIHGDEKHNDMTELECVKDGSTETYSYVISDGDPGNPTKKPVTDAGLYTFFCSANMNEACTEPHIDCTKGVDCPVFTPGKKGEPAKLTCTDNKWVIGGEYVVLETEPFCTDDFIANANEAAFFITRPSESDKKLDGKEDRCFTNYDCEKKSPQVFNSGVRVSGGVVTCENPAIQLSITDFGKNGTLSAASVSCDPATGAWKNTTDKADGETIGVGSSFSCVEMDKLRQNSTSKYTDAQVYTIISCSAVGIVVFIVLIGVLIYCLRTHSGGGARDKKSWLKLSRAEKLEDCEMVFGKVLKTTPSTRQHLILGLQQLDLLLETETADPRIWKLVYPFLMRVRGAVTRADSNIWHMFSRYCYLQAKKIIDKHGWRTSKPIRMKKQKGVIRAVAARLLGFALGNPQCREAYELLEQGFRKLGYNAIEQYPHCGVLWSVILHSRPLTYKAKAGGKLAEFDAWDCMTKLQRIAFDWPESIMPKDEIIPTFGQVSQQAAHALGGWWNYNWHKDEARDILKKTEPIGAAHSFFAGMCLSLSVNPSGFVLDTLALWFKPNTQLLADMALSMTQEQLHDTIDQTMRLMTYYARGLDSNRLEERFIPTTPQPSAKVLELQVEQQEFESAMDKQLEHLRQWYADHTDKDELKAKPDYKGKGGKPDGGSTKGSTKRANKSVKRESKRGTKSASESKSNVEVQSNKAVGSASNSSKPADDGAAALVPAPPPAVSAAPTPAAL